MIHDLDLLTEEEREFILQVPVLITFLIAGSDNNIDDKEREWAQKLVEFRSSRNESKMVPYYLEVENKWDDNFTKYAGMLMDYDNVDLRNHFISNELKKLNGILTKLPSETADMLYKSFRSFAEQVARASGGIFGFGAVSREEQQWLRLPMIEKPELS